MPKSIHLDHHDTAHYIPMYHRTGGFTGHEREVYKSLVSRLFHEGRVIEPTYLDDQPNLRPTFAAIGFDFLLNINEKICPIFVLQFYKSVRLIRKLNGTIAIAFIIKNFEITLTLEEFSRLKIPCQGVCVFTPDWPISSLQLVVDPHPDIYPPPHEDPSLIRDALFYERTQAKTRKIKGVDTILDPFQMIVSELKTEFKKWEVILSENVISLTGNKDHLNACLCYMLYCLATKKPFNLAYYIVNRIVSVAKSADMTLPYGMLLTRLFKHVRTNHPYTFSNELYLVDHVMTPISKKRVYRFKDKGKRPRLPTPTPPDTKSSNSPSPTSHQNVENDPVNNYTLDLIPYINQLPPIEGGESPESKQTKGMFKCLFNYLCKKK
ncbi:hypothetical protein Tco_1293156 [Tanacetum coccineum]